jgi:DNA-binding NarL/FixJ family response regulator
MRAPTSMSLTGPASVARELLLREVRAVTGDGVNVIDHDLPGWTLLSESSGRWLFISSSTSPGQETASALSDGASAVLTLGSAPHELARAFRALSNELSAVYVAADVLVWMAAAAVGRAFDPAPARLSAAPLSDREREVVLGVGEGLTNGEIAERLGVSISTIRSHLQSAGGKLGFSTRARLIAYGQRLQADDQQLAGLLLDAS